MNIRAMICVGGMLAVAVAFAEITYDVSDVNARQRYPWNGKVDVDFRLNSSDSEAKYTIRLEALDLVGKLGSIVCGEADAVGCVYRKSNETHISFKGGDGTIKEARAPHLRGNDIIIATGNEDGTITTYWDRIFKSEN